LLLMAKSSDTRACIGFVIGYCDVGVDGRL
jgi:hypothetical protein